MPNYYNPVKIVHTNDWINELKISIKDSNLSNPIIISSPGNCKRLNINSIFNSESVFLQKTSNPTINNCNEIINFCKKDEYDGVIAIGGGSVMDLSKVIIAYLCLGIENVKELINFRNPYPKRISSIFVPTTHGTASEVTMWGTIWDMKQKALSLKKTMEL